jgi:hypothetical protein
MATPSGDGLDALTEGRPTTDTDEPRYGDPEDGNAAKLLTLPPREAAKFAYQLWKEQPQGPISRRRAEWQVNAWRREGRTNVFVQKTEDQNRWQAWAPPWTAPPIPVLNKADRLCRRLTAMMFADNPVPEVVPDPEDEDAAAFAERVLRDVQGEGQLDDLRAARRAFDRASVFGSGFIRYFIDPKGGGRKPVRVMAKAGAMTAEQPFTGPMGEPLPGDLVSRYVREDGSLTDEPAEAATRWMPAISSEQLEPPNVRFLPHDAEDLWDAEGVMIATMPTWAELVDLWPELEQLPEEDREALFSFKPEQAKDLLGMEPVHNRANEQIQRKEDKRVAVFTVYIKACPNYPQGCYFVGLGDRTVAFRGPWTAKVDGVEEPLDLPLTQYTQFEAGRPDPFGAGLMHLLGNGNEIRAAQVGHLLSYLDQFTNRKVFIPTNSILQPRSYQLMQGTAIPINPGGEPKFEEVPDFPQAPLQLFGLMSEEMNDQSTLQQTAQGTEVQGVNSGRQASIIVEQAKAGASDLRQNVERAYVRACRIQLQLIRAHYTVPQQLEWTGEDGSYRQKWWTGADLKSSKDIRLKRGSLSMMTPEQKLNLALTFKQYGLYDMAPDLFYDTVANSLGPTVGLQDDPVRMRIKRQLAAWSEGPPEGWQPPQPPMMMGPDGVTPVPAMDPATGQPMPPPPDPVLSSIFAPLPPDELQDVAVVRLMELKRFMQTTKYSRWPVPWRLGVDLEYQRMKQAAGVMTLQEQAMLEQQQAEAEAQAAAEQRAHELEMAKAKAPEETDKEITRDPTGRMTGIKNVRREPAAQSA